MNATKLCDYRQITATVNCSILSQYGNLRVARPGNQALMQLQQASSMQYERLTLITPYEPCLICDGSCFSELFM